MTLSVLVQWLTSLHPKLKLQVLGASAACGWLARRPEFVVGHSEPPQPVVARPVCSLPVAAPHLLPACPVVSGRLPRAHNLPGAWR